MARSLAQPQAGTDSVITIDRNSQFSAGLSAIHAARHRVWKTRFSKLAGISMMSRICRDMEKFGGHHSTRRTAAMALLNVGSGLRYQAAAFGRSGVVVSRARPSAHTVISENSPSSADKVPLRGPHRVAIYAARDACAPTPLDRVIDADDHRTAGQQAIQHMPSGIDPAPRGSDGTAVPHPAP